MKPQDCKFGHELSIYELRQRIRQRNDYILELEHRVIQAERYIAELVAIMEHRYFDLTEDSDDETPAGATEPI